ncbi:MAG: sulfite exporter TauE/SafE family protein [Dehalococcoidia bacterium]
MDSIYVAPLLFFFIPFLFSMLGMGGAQVYVPILFWLGMDLKTEAIPLALLLNVVSTASASVTYLSRHLVEWKIALVLGGSMAIFAPVGARINVGLSTTQILLFFALFTIAAAALMISGWQPKGEKLTKGKLMTLSIPAGGILGFIVGLLGRGGGAFVVPTLHIGGIEAKRAAATSVLAITVAALSGFLAHLAMAARPEWIVWALCVVAVIAGSQAGSRTMAGRLQSRSIRLMFGIVLVCIALALIVHDVILA